NIEPELLRIILINKCLDKIVLYTKNNNRLSNSFTILKEQILDGSIAIPDEFESQNLL
ncbi:25125_t:CDS:1, partial [Racocetra persica]